MIKVLLLSCTLSLTRAIIVTDPPTIASPLDYKYLFNVDDPTTGDTKTHHEIRRGDVVTGQYSVLEPDGTKRIVDYHVHPREGFNAIVHIEPPSTENYIRRNNYVIPINSPNELKRLYETEGTKLYTSIDIADPQDTVHESKGIYFVASNKILSSYNNHHKVKQYFIPAQSKKK